MNVRIQVSLVVKDVASISEAVKNTLKIFAWYSPKDVIESVTAYEAFGFNEGRSLAPGTPTTATEE